MGFVTGGPNEAIVVSGCFHSQPLIVVGGWAFVIPCIQKVQRLPLNIMTLKVASPKVYTMQGVPLSVTGIAQVSIIPETDPLGSYGMEVLKVFCLQKKICRVKTGS